MKVIRVLLVGFEYLHHNYGAQGIIFPFIRKLRHHFDVCSFVMFRGKPNPFVTFKMRYFPFYFAYRLLKSRGALAKQHQQLEMLKSLLRRVDVVIDVSGIEFVGSFSIKHRYLEYFATAGLQMLAEHLHVPFVKFTMSYGPFPEWDFFYRFLVQRCLNKLPFVLVRGRRNLAEVNRLRLKVPVYNFPDVSLCLEPASKRWASLYVEGLGVDVSRGIVGLSPSAVIANLKGGGCSGTRHIRLCRAIIEFFQSKHLQVLLIPHSIYDGEDLRHCDLALARKLYTESANKNNLFLVDGTDLSYKQVRAIIGLLDFYVAARYHAVTSALCMAVPTVVLSWHTKYQDLTELFSDGWPILDCEQMGESECLAVVKAAFLDRGWFSRKTVLENKQKVLAKVEASVALVAKQINKHKNECELHI